MNVCILAVTAVGDNYSIAGISTDGEWVRPISTGLTAPYWDDIHLSFDLGFGFIRVGDIIEFDAHKPKDGQGYNAEDYIVDSGDMILKRRLSNDELLWFLEAVAESQAEFEDTVHGKGRSLCVVKVDRMNHYLLESPGQLPAPKIALVNSDFDLINPMVGASNFIVKDCKWRSLIRLNKVNNTVDYNHIYIVIGLEPMDNKDKKLTPQIIGVCTDPEIKLLNTYPN